MPNLAGVQVVRDFRVSLRKKQTGEENRRETKDFPKTPGRFGSKKTGGGGPVAKGIKKRRI